MSSISPGEQIGGDSSLEDIRSRAMAGALKLGVRNVLVRGVGLVGTVVLARLLKPADFGLVALGLSIQLLGNVISSGGLGAELIRREKPPTHTELRCVLGYQLLAAFAIAGLASIPAVVIGGQAGFIALFTFSVPIAVLDTPCRIVLSRSLNWDLIAYSEVAGTLGFNVVAVGLVILGASIWGVAIATIIQAMIVVGLLVAIGPVGLPLPQFSFSTIRPLLRFGLAYQTMVLIDRGRDQAVNILTAAIGGLALLGVWSVAYRIFLSIMVVLEALWQVSFPAMTRMLEAGQDARHMVDRVLRLNGTAFGFPAVAVAGTAPALIPTLFGPHFDAAIPVLPWGAAALLLTGPVVTAGLSFIQAKGDSRGMIHSYLVQTAVWLALGSFLIPIFGAEGVGMAMFVAAIALVITIRRTTQKYVPMDFLSVVWPPITAAAIAAVIGWMIASQVNPSILGLVTSLIASECLYLLILFALRRRDIESLFTTLQMAVRSASPAKMPVPRPSPMKEAV
ncbi:MAG TPA: oligosaccharide flippase family protein [Solirubrobacterales bacterium]|nr:oligosaccharide flippase family protein [Solirubrobacterales bacterium]